MTLVIFVAKNIEKLGQNFKQLNKKKISSSQSFNTLYTLQMNFGGKYISVY